MNTKTEYVTLSVSDGTSMRAYVAHPAGKPRAGLLVFQEAFGVTLTFATSPNGSPERAISRFRQSCFIAPRPAWKQATRISPP